MTLLAPVLFAASALAAAQAPQPPPALPPLPPSVYVAPTDIALKSALSPWPAEGSAADRADIETARMVDKLRTQDMVDAANRFAALSPELWFQEITGNQDALKAAPKTRALFAALQSDMRGINRAANAIHPWRKRPADRDIGITPSLPRGQFATSSYPSANASMVLVWAEVTKRLLPTKVHTIREKADTIAWLRVVGGMHFPSDVVGSREVAKEAVTTLNRSPAWQRALTDASAEWLAGQRQP
jgi:acid phosphatase (class A)